MFYGFNHFIVDIVILFVEKYKPDGFHIFQAWSNFFACIKGYFGHLSDWISKSPGRFGSVQYLYHHFIGRMNIMSIFQDLILFLNKRGINQFIFSSLKHLFMTLGGNFQVELKSYYFMVKDEGLILAPIGPPITISQS